MQKRLHSFLQTLKRHPGWSILSIVLLLLIVLPHFLYLSNFPPGLAHDEIEYTLSARTYALRGADLSGYGLPLGLFKTETEGNISFVPIILLSPFAAFLPMGQVAARLPYVLLNLATAVTLYFFTLYLLKDKRIALLSGVLFLINPWSFFLSRFAAEPPFALFFYLLGSALLLRLRGAKLAFPFIALVLGFFSYHGAKLMLLPLILILLLYRIFVVTPHAEKLSYKQALVFFVGLLIIVGGFFFISKAIPGSIVNRRTGELVSLSSPAIEKNVDIKRKIAITSPLMPLYANKVTEVSRYVLEKYLGAFSPDVLFLHGDARMVYRFQEHGLFYLIDSVLILVGIAVLARWKRPQLLLLAVLVLLAPIASALNDIETSYVNRAFFLLPMLIIFAASGLATLLSFPKRKWPKIFTYGVLICIIGISFANFLIFYFFRYPIAFDDLYTVNDRVLAKFLQEAKLTNRNIIVSVVEPRHAYLTWLYDSNNTDNLKTHLAHVKAFNNGTYRMQNITFTRDCVRKNDKKSLYIVENTLSCFPSTLPSYAINNPKDAGTMYKIYNTSLCRGSYLTSWKRYHTPTDYRIEPMDKATFCREWIAPVVQ